MARRVYEISTGWGVCSICDKMFPVASGCACTKKDQKQ